MAETQYPDLSITDDWNARAPKPVTSFADDVARASNEPTLGKYHEDDTEFVETSVGAVPADSETADAARDVARKVDEDDETAGTPEPGDSGATEPAARKNVKRVENAKTTDA